MYDYRLARNWKKIAKQGAAGDPVEDSRESLPEGVTLLVLDARSRVVDQPRGFHCVRPAQRAAGHASVIAHARQAAAFE
jgi:hypothetical protein